MLAAGLPIHCERRDTRRPCRSISPDVLEREVAPALRDCSLESFDDTFLGSAREGLRGGQPILNGNEPA